jgi:hypothetical protein
MRRIDGYLWKDRTAHALLYGGGPVDEHGRPVERTKHSHPYSYSGFVLHRLGPNSDATDSVYTDRMQQWDWDKADRCHKAHMPGKRWDNASPQQMEAYLRDYMGDPDLRLVLVMEYCNVSSGYPVWRLDYRSGKAATDAVPQVPQGDL